MTVVKRANRGRRANGGGVMEAFYDGYAALVDDNPLSVATGRAMDAIAADRDRVWDSRQGEIAGDAPQKPAPRKPFASRPAGARKRAMPDTIVPQLATLADKPPDGDEWLHDQGIGLRAKPSQRQTERE